MKVYTLLLFDSKYDSAHYCITCLRRSILAVDEFIMLYLKAASWLMYLKSRPHTSGLFISFFFTEIDCLWSFSHVQDGQFRDIY